MSYAPAKKKIQVVSTACRVKCADCAYDVEWPLLSIEGVLDRGIFYQDGKCPCCGSANITAEDFEKREETEGFPVAPWQDPGGEL